MSSPVEEEPIAATNIEASAINDRRFLAQLRELKNLKEFLFEQKVKFDPEQLRAIDLGSLNNLYFNSSGRLPELAEWKLLDEKLSVLASYLSDELRQKIRIRELGLFFGTLPLAFLLLALTTIIYRFLYGAFFEKGTLLFNASFLFSLILWTVSQGGLGACAFLGTRIATERLGKTQIQDIGEIADVTDESILKIRIILGCLFGSIIGLPIATISLDKMANAIYGDSSSLAPTDFALMILPFLVGFSTNLVLAILERCIESVRTFFGMNTK